MDFQNAPVAVTRTDCGYKVAILGSVHTNVAWIERELDKVIAAKPKQVDLDLSACPFLSSTGIGLVTGLYNRIKAEGGSLKIVAIQKPVFGVFRLSRLDAMLKIAPESIIAAKA